MQEPCHFKLRPNCYLPQSKVKTCSTRFLPSEVKQKEFYLFMVLFQVFDLGEANQDVGRPLVPAAAAGRASPQPVLGPAAG